MIEHLYIPADCKELEPYGTCGPACVAVLARTTIRDVLAGSYNTDAGAFLMKGHITVTDLIRLLGRWGYSAKRKPAHKLRTFGLFPGKCPSIARVQWLKHDGSEYYWAEASTHTHYVLLNDGLVFCNFTGWFELSGECAKEYLKLGYISSYLELTKKGAQE